MLRKIAQIQSNTCRSCAKVYRDSDLGEFEVHVFNEYINRETGRSVLMRHEPSTYFTSDKADAFGTAEQMMNPR